ncbi:HAD family hydrolase [Natrononativus amylolyticus]|uniref:HAD family hydrolase n=1 Tax=Natrononativus amylolyticus TaxID=2963434 RepID=UPI0020CD730D|nr:HAD family hydrolase [Natrononativus amylolyticus]
MSVDAVLFDFDDTLYPYSPCNEAGKRAAHRVARERGYDLEREAFEEFYRTGRRDVKLDLAGRAASHERYLYFKRALERRTGTPKPGDARALGEAYWEAYVEAMALFPGVEETLETLRENGIAVGVTTNLTTHVQLRKLEAVGLEPYLDALVTSEETGQEKPASVMFTLPLARLDCRVSRAVMVGDNVDADVVGANALGLETVLWNWEGDGPLEGQRAPDHRIDAFEALTEVVL